jgi:hypothetical protein
MDGKTMCFYSSMVSARTKKRTISSVPLDEYIPFLIMKPHVGFTDDSADYWRKNPFLVDTDPGNFTRC